MIPRPPPIRLGADVWLYERQNGDPAAREATLRRHLAGFLSCRPDDLVLERDGLGKPRLAGPASRLGFNLSHRADLLVIATAWDRPVGVDLEVLNDEALEGMSVAGAFFSMGEQDWLNGLAAALRTEAFFRLWTAKEALLKSCGRGIAQGGLAWADFSSFLPPGLPLPWESLYISLDQRRFHLRWFQYRSAAAPVIIAEAQS